jgi:hypothetical protein
LLSQVFPDPGDRIFKNWGMTARVNVMFHPMGKMKGNFAANASKTIRDWLQCQ